MPVEAVMAAGHGLRIGRSAKPEIQIDRAVRIRPRLIVQQPNRPDNKAGFFGTFPAGGVAGTLTGMTFPAGEFRMARQRSIVTTHADQKPSGPFDDGNSDRRHQFNIRLAGSLASRVIRLSAVAAQIGTQTRRFNRRWERHP